MKKPSPIFFALFAVIACVCLLDSCSKAKTSLSACIAIAPSTASIGATLPFTSCTPGAGSYTWDFGDGSNATGDSVTHIYTAAGTYRGSLTVTSGSATSTKSFDVTIVPNSWVFKGSTYSIDSVVVNTVNSTLTASGTSGTSTASLIFRFFPFPANTSYYTVINAENGNNAHGQLYVLLNRDSAGVKTLYGSTGSNEIIATATVAAGKLGMFLPAIELANLNNASDSTTLSGSVAQTQ